MWFSFIVQTFFNHLSMSKQSNKYKDSNFFQNLKYVITHLNYVHIYKFQIPSKNWTKGSKMTLKFDGQSWSFLLTFNRLIGKLKQKYLFHFFPLKNVKSWNLPIYGVIWDVWLDTLLKETLTTFKTQRLYHLIFFYPNRNITISLHT